MIDTVMYAKILVPLDGSEESKSVLPYIRALSARYGSEADILGVGIGSKKRRVNRLLEEYIYRVTNDLNQDSVKAKPIIMYGRPAEQILMYAEENGIDLIIMATHGRSGIARWWLGSVAETVVNEARTPVCLVPNIIYEKKKLFNTASINTILLPLDGSNIGESALPHAEALAMKIGSSVSLIHVIPSPEALEVNVIGLDFTRLNKAMHDSGENYLKDVAERIGKKGIKTNYKVVTGDPANMIVEYAAEIKADLIAMSTHGRSGIARWVLGSVADKILHEASMPVWLVRSPKMMTIKAKI